MKTLCRRWTPVLAYPCLMLAGFLIHYLLLYLQFSLTLATWIPVSIGLFTIILLENLLPFRKEWNPERNDWVVDVAYMVLVQLLLVNLLKLIVAITIVRFVQSNEYFLTTVWPNQWPDLLQALLMLLTAEFFRYWLHRFSHAWNPLWRLHAVHHSPHKLYSMNVGRFHPLEKAIQFLFDSLPFILLGISENVLALYLLFYSVNGFFQHCNIKLKLGLLNYVISGPELHRWHHSIVVAESNNNYGNNLIVWDLTFGTWYLPEEARLDRLGLLNRNYPMDLWNQLKSPFIKGLDQNDDSMVPDRAS